MSKLFRNDSPGAKTLEQARADEIKRQRELRRQAAELAAQGRGEDTEIAHVALGEIVVPEALQTPEFMAALERAAETEGISIDRLRVGGRRNRINPNTGAPEFDPTKYEGADMEGITVSTTEDPETTRRARVIYGETASIYPQRIDPKASIYNPNNWDPASADALAKARRQIGVVSNRNDITHSDSPDMSNPLQKQQWERALEAARASDALDQSFDPTAGRFYMWQKGSYQDQYVPSYNALDSTGPFYTSGGGRRDKKTGKLEVPPGGNLYIDFFKK
jgi:hypothetical protein